MLVRRVVTALVLVYLLLDMSLPSVRGAFEFDPDASVDCARIEPASDEAPSPLPAAVVSAPLCHERAVVRVVRVAPAPVVTEPTGVARNRLRAAADAPPPSEDH